MQLAIVRPSPPALPDWVLESLPWLAAALLIAVCAGVAGVWVLVGRLRELERMAGRLDALEDVRAGLSRLVADREDLDLRRVEHVLIEMRDGQKRLEDAFLRTVQRPSAEFPQASGAAPADVRISERVTNRLLALGYEQIRILSEREQLESVSDTDGEILVEARRHGSICKGRVHVRSGALTDVDLQPSWSTFP